MKKTYIIILSIIGIAAAIYAITKIHQLISTDIKNIDKVTEDSREMRKENFRQKLCGTTPTHYDISPESTKLLNEMCDKSSIFINKYIKDSSSFLLNLKKYMCNQETQKETLRINNNLYHKMLIYIPYDKLEHIRTHLDYIQDVEIDIGNSNDNEMCTTI